MHNPCVDASRIVLVPERAPAASRDLLPGETASQGPTWRAIAQSGHTAGNGLTLSFASAARIVGRPRSAGTPPSRHPGADDRENAGLDVVEVEHVGDVAAELAARRARAGTQWRAGRIARRAPAHSAARPVRGSRAGAARMPLAALGARSRHGAWCGSAHLMRSDVRR